MSKPYSINYGLMVKQELLNEIHSTTTNVRRLSRHVDHLTRNLPINIETLPLDLDHADFSDWFFSRLVQLKKFSILKTYTSKIEKLYQELGSHYNVIYTIYANERKQTWIRDLLELSPLPLSTKTYQKSQYHYKQFAQLIHELLVQLDTFEKYFAIQPNEDLLTYC